MSLSVPSRLRRRCGTAAVVVASAATALVGLAAPGGAMTANATPDTPDNAPYVVALVSVFANGHDAFQYCSGTLVTPTLVVTASHCANAAEYFAGRGFSLAVTNVPTLPANPAGNIDWTSVPATRKAAVTDNHLNPAYRSGRGTDGYREDVSAQEIAAPLGGVGSTFPALPAPRLLDAMRAAGTLRTTPFRVYGYGTEAREQNGTLVFADSNERRYADLDALALSEQWLTQAQNRAKGDAGACYGDSGGPSFLGPDATPTLVAVTSTGDMPCWATNVASRVDRPEALAFLAPLVESTSGA
jgi:hypothetical protein